ncbi:MAG: family 78 glycoside hydrolase catalytic domain [Microthrixaceae bacterium]
MPAFPAPERWVGRWIEPVERAGGPVAQRPALHLAGEFTIGGPVGQAVLHITAHGIYEAFLNGRRVGDLELTPGFTAYRSHLHVQTFDVTEHLRAGRNAVGALLSDGWWRGRSGPVRQPDAYGPRTALLAELEVTTTDGATIRIGTGDDWRSTPGHILGADLVAGEVHDLRRRVHGWAEPGTDRSTWSPVTVVDHPTDVLRPPVGPPTRRVGTLPARSVTELGPGRHVIDFGRNSNGWIRLVDVGPEGTELTITYGEAIDPAGDVIQSNVAASNLEVPLEVPVPFQTDRVVSAGPGSVFEPRHSTKGFRYVRIDGHPGQLHAHDITGVVVHSDLDRIGAFRCSDPSVNELQRIAEWSFLTNACEIPTDCPTRERAGWVGDWQIYVATAAELFDITEWSRRWLRDLAADQHADGSVTNIVPDPSSGNPAWRFTQGSAGWGDAAVHVPWELYRATGRTDVLEAQFTSMRRWLDVVRAAAASGRHPSRVARNAVALPHERYVWDTGWHWGEWLEPGDQSDADAVALRLLDADHGIVATAYFHRSADELAQIATVLGDRAAEDEYSAVAAAVLDAWRTEFVTPDGSLTVPTQANLVRALAFGLAPEELRGRFADDLVRLIRAAGTHLGTGFLATPFLLPVLADTGHLDVAYELLFRRTEPSWLRMLDLGATTVWEQWDAVRPDGTVAESLNHYSKGAVISFLRRYVAGLQILEPGYRRFRVAPRPGGGITAASTHHDSPHGRIEVHWNLSGTAGTANVVVPRGTVAAWNPPAGTGRTLPPGSYSLTWRG